MTDEELVAVASQLPAEARGLAAMEVDTEQRMMI
jgi:hypothetical protein